MRRATAIAILFWLPLSAALADVYRSVDAQGHVQYSDTPTPGAELVRMNRQRMPIRAAAAPSTTSGTNSASSKPTPLAQSGDLVPTAEQEAAARAVHNDVAQMRAEQCKKAQDAYDQSLQARRIYKVGANGEREYLTDDEADKARVANKLAVDTACKAL
jgi:Domain of unknown function (DUF4124)